MRTDPMKRTDVHPLVHSLHALVTAGPWNLDIAWAMSLYGYDEVKWAEGQAMLAELISCDAPPRTVLVAAVAWYKAAAMVAQHALADRPQLLTKLGVEEG